MFSTTPYSKLVKLAAMMFRNNVSDSDGDNEGEVEFVHPLNVLLDNL